MDAWTRTSADVGECVLEEAWKPLLQMLQKNLCLLVHLPATLASGHRKLVDKVKVLVYNWRLESADSLSLERIAQQYVSFTSDLGTEASIPNCHIKLPYSSLLPEWMKPPEIDMEIGLGGANEPRDIAELSDFGGSDDMSDMPRASGLWGLLTCQLILCSPDHLDLERVKLKNTAAFPEIVLLHTMSAIPKGEPLAALMPNAMLFPGLQHIASNLCQDIESVMVGWSSFYQELKNIESLLRMAERRTRLIHTCLPPELADRKQDLQRWSASLYQHRWHEVVHFIRELQVTSPRSLHIGVPNHCSSIAFPTLKKLCQSNDFALVFHLSKKQ